MCFELNPDKASLRTSVNSLLKFCMGHPSNTNTEGNVEGIEEVSAKQEESGFISVSVEDVQKIESGLLNSTYMQALKFGFKAALILEDWELAEECLTKLTQNSCERAIYEAIRHKNPHFLENFVESVDACEILCNDYLEKDDLEGAASYAQHALEITENSYRAWMVLGKVFEKSGEKTESLRCYLKATESVLVDFSIIPIYL